MGEAVKFCLFEMGLLAGDGSADPADYGVIAAGGGGADEPLETGYR